MNLKCFKKIFFIKNKIDKKLFNAIDKLIFNFDKYLLNEYIEGLKINHEIQLYMDYTELINFIYKNDSDSFRENLIDYLSDCIRMENGLLNNIDYFEFNNQWLYKSFKLEIQKLSKKFLLDIINELKDNSYFTRDEFFNLLIELKKEFKIREKLKSYKDFLISAKKPKSLKHRNLNKIKKEIQCLN